jgi:nucleotide-binding universal stress UspA family protein
MTNAWTSRVVVGYDDTPPASAALAFAAHECRLRDVALVVVHQVEGREVPEVRCSAREAAAQLHRVEQTVRDAVAPITLGLTVEVRAVEHPIANALVDVGSAAAVVVVGANVSHATLGAILQSVSRDVVHDAPCPVILVPASEAGPKRVERIVCGVNRSPASVAALTWAGLEAALREVPLLVIEVGEPTSGNEVPLGEWVVDLLPEPRCDVTWSSTAGTPADNLLAAAGDDSLVVIGHHEPHGCHWHRSVARALIAQLQTPVVVVPIRGQS